jgi:hypothetical protein
MYPEDVIDGVCVAFARFWQRIPIPEFDVDVE